ncbi:MAG: hypothetical protein UZ22_OP11002000925 [Microgenomates bacterium OLB23]|nr:MAG: hypothetical protein UZ22_OP11002000925 [Microgenomates bacterium OLB23]
MTDNDTPNKENYLESIIQELDTLLINGFLLQRDWFYIYKSEKDKAGEKFEQEKFIKVLADRLNNWFQSVVSVLDHKFKEKYHLHHFMGAKSLSFSHSGIPQELSNLKGSAESHLQALEEIIIRLIEKSNLQIRREIAEIEHESDVLYRVTFSEHIREIKINNIVVT